VRYTPDGGWNRSWASLFSDMGSTPTVTIVADVHERVSGIPDALVRFGALVEVASLPAGDYAVGAETIVERKSVLDLHGAILKGRFWPQLGKLKADCEFPYLLVEGRELDRGPLHPNAIRGACLTAMELGIALLRSDDRDDSARWLHRLAVRRRRVERAPDRPAYAQRPKVSPGASAAEAALAVVPGISVACARALLARFGSVQAVLQASVVELVDVPGIGSERARALEQTFHSQVGVPTPSEEAASAPELDRPAPST
jgi:ERCC4-type nuclease